ncbi:MAG: RNA methyltransferase [Candidatus Cloacimonetes bacterium]|nr:RNA methyltransferase [Candidatus Cloacimonadota bacterium]
MKNIYVGLVHYPILNKFGDVVTTSITNLDIHDISRSCMTFGVKKFFIINPLKTQEQLFKRILKFWKSEIANCYNPDRVTALSIIEYEHDIESVIKKINLQEEDCLVITTTAANLKAQLSFEDYGKIDKPVLLLFGTGNGLTDEVHKLADHVLKPIKGIGDYNHLSVRSAAAIVLNRLTSDKIKEE